MDLLLNIEIKMEGYLRPKKHLGNCHISSMERLQDRRINQGRMQSIRKVWQIKVCIDLVVIY